MLNSPVYAEAQGWLGVRWLHQGRTRLGIDCAGLVLVVGQSLKLLPGDLNVSNYSRDPTSLEFLQMFSRHMDRVPLLQATAGDILVFRQRRYPCHCGILGDGEKFIHAYALRRKVVEEYLTDEWLSLRVAAFRFRS